MNHARSIVLAALVAASGATSACEVSTYPPAVGAYSTVYAQDVPVDIYAYPHTSFEGRDAYLVGDHWYYPSERGWVVLRTEPPQLHRYRSNYVQQAPPAYPPGQYYERSPAPYAYPPPATRVR